MGRRIYLLITFSLCIFVKTYARQVQGNIYIKISSDQFSGKEITEISIENVDFIVSPKFKQLPAKISKNSAIWNLKTQDPILINLSSILGKDFMYVPCEPGDSLVVSQKDGELAVTGKGSEKIDLIRQYLIARDQISKPKNKDFSKVISVQDHKDWVIYLNNQAALFEQTISAYQAKLSPFAYDYIKVQVLSEVDYQLLLRFAFLRENARKFGLNCSELAKILDHILSESFLTWLHGYQGKTYAVINYYQYVKEMVIKNANYDWNSSSLQDIARTTNYYKEAKKLLKGNALENCLLSIMTEKGIKELTYKYCYVPEFEQLLKTYYLEATNPRHVEYLQDYDQKIHNWATGMTKLAYNFSLPDTTGKMVSMESLKGRIVLLNFWDSNSEQSRRSNEVIAKLRDRYAGDRRIVFVNICVDSTFSSWKKGLRGHQLNGQGINLFTAELGRSHPVVRAFNVMAYPSMFLYDSQGISITNPANSEYADPRLVSTRFPDILSDNGLERLRTKIETAVAALDDGPYIFKANKKAEIKSIRNLELKTGSGTTFDVATDEYGKSFKVALQKSISVQPSQYLRPSKVIAFSDIEGNFDKLRLLLKANGVIGKDYNWTFGNGHLVLAGDIFDRGEQVTECLWLIYSLEEKARAAGGEVHFILGNHEIMNLQGDHRYVDAKYERSAKLIGKTMTQLYGEDSELGRWLRTKNVVERIGDLLFVHGGLSSQVNRSSLSVSDMNKLARPFYANKKEDYGDANTNLVMSQTYGPFWYRGYYDAKTNPAAAVDSILTKYNAKHIVTGHTIIADTISLLYNNKVINTDVPHAKGKSEALLVEGNSFYRVNDKGQRWLLFKDPEKKPLQKIKNE